MTTMLTFYYILAFMNVFMAGMLVLNNTFATKKAVWYLLTVLWILQVFCYFSHVGYYPLSGIAPTCTIAALTLCLCQSLSLTRDVGSKRPFFSGMGLLVLAVVSLVPENVPHNSFMMSYLFAILFFLSRPFSLGLTLYALAGMGHLFREGADNRIYRTSKDAAFLASIIFLGGEIVGCYWGFMGWGTTWRWSGNFQFSAMLFVLYMVSLHVPATLFRSRKGYNIAFSAPLVCVVFCMLISKVIS